MEKKQNEEEVNSDRHEVQGERRSRRSRRRSHDVFGGK